MSVFTIESLPASFGDALWIEYGEEDRIHHVLIDGGVAGTFAHVEAKVLQLSRPRRLELLMVTHVDEDHIAGMVKLLGAVQDLELDVNEVWFNGRDHLDGKQVALDRLGSKQGEFLAAMLSKQTIHWNKAFEGWPVEVSARGALPSRMLAGGMRLTVLSPGRPQLEAMIKKWDKELTDAKPKIDWTDGDAVLAFLEGQPTLKPRDALGGSRNVDELVKQPFDPDTAEANGTSIAVLAEFADRAVLLGADAYAPVLSASIDRLLKERDIERLRLHLFKLPHHGSAGNISIDLLDKLDCGHYLVSTNGKRYNHPDGAAIARIVRHGGADPFIHFNYRSDSSGVWDDEDLGQGIEYHASYPADGEEGCVIDVAGLPP
ncbi:MULTISPECIES: ComEC/Rec2 family competence protein [unclassified Rhizobacter]|uniref:ComEC/Rec2 family competence protein n=1 Tax=unclassified Rhizobacter TaxID=2640088 RepID=UPI000701C852|nr:MULTISPECIES: hypothetical protein [unclassified Rhizobacter]KQW04387.1 hypothetical protein ASC98_04645 [Rhizobacter sp. Root1238]KRB14482.1 hypothetical protein ASE08_08495 [Rhizobacter sp. Root16D2]